LVLNQEEKEWKRDDRLESICTGTASRLASGWRTEEIAVEVTGNPRLFHDAVAPHVKRVVAVNPNQFKVITHSVKKADPNDARNLALYLANLLPEVRMKDKTRAQIASLTQTRDTMVKLRTALKNKISNIFSAHGINLSKESLASEKGLKAVLETRFDLPVDLELKILVEQIRALNKSIAELEETISREKPEAGRPQESDLGQGNRRAQRRHAVVDHR
jgi:Transposase